MQLVLLPLYKQKRQRMVILKNRRLIMRTLFYIIAVVLLVGWALGTFVYALGKLIYILFVLAIVAFVLGLARRDTPSDQ